MDVEGTWWFAVEEAPHDPETNQRFELRDGRVFTDFAQSSVGAYRVEDGAVVVSVEEPAGDGTYSYRITLRPVEGETGDGRPTQLQARIDDGDDTGVYGSFWRN